MLGWGARPQNNTYVISVPLKARPGCDASNTRVDHTGGRPIARACKLSPRKHFGTSGNRRTSTTTSRRRAKRCPATQGTRASRPTKSAKSDRAPYAAASVYPRACKRRRQSTPTKFPRAKQRHAREEDRQGQRFRLLRLSREKARREAKARAPQVANDTNLPAQDTEKRELSMTNDAYGTVEVQRRPSNPQTPRRRRGGPSAARGLRSGETGALDFPRQGRSWWGRRRRRH